jgi:uncharacterized membrane protein YbhN (UPF0104 family)
MHGITHIFAGILESLGSVSLWALALAVVLHLAKVVAEARAWHGIVSHAHRERDVRFRTTLGAFTGSLGANALLPGRVGEAYRIGVMRRHVRGSSIASLSATMVLETLLELVFGVTVIVAVVLAGRSVGPVRSPAHATASLFGHPALIAVVATVGTALLVWVAVDRGRVGALLGRMRQGFSVVAAPRALLGTVLVWKLLAWTLRLAMVYWFLIAFHLSSGLWIVLLVIAAQSLAGLVPLMPGNAGTQQAALVVVLAGTASGAATLGFGIGMQMTTTLADVALGAAAATFLCSRSDLRRMLWPSRRPLFSARP